jgi:hypothetical protein
VGLAQFSEGLVRSRSRWLPRRRSTVWVLSVLLVVMVVIVVVARITRHL